MRRGRRWDSSIILTEFIGELSTQTLTGLVSLAEARPEGVARMPGDAAIQRASSRAGLFDVPARSGLGLFARQLRVQVVLLQRRCRTARSTSRCFPFFLKVRIRVSTVSSAKVWPGRFIVLHYAPDSPRAC